MQTQYVFSMMGDQYMPYVEPGHAFMQVCGYGDAARGDPIYGEVCGICENLKMRGLDGAGDGLQKV